MKTFVILLACCLGCGVSTPMAFANANDVRLLEDLIRIPSVSGDVPAVNRAVDFLRGRLEAEGIFCSVETMPDGREVLFAANAETKTPDILLSAHLDVVPAQNQSQFVPELKGGRLYGRGASDCKEHCVLAVRLLGELKDRVSVGCLFGSDEEIGGASTAFMLRRGYAARKMVMVFDSEQFAITTWQKGLAHYRVLKKLPAVHAGMVKGPVPNAAEELMRGYLELAGRIPAYEDGSWRDVLSLVGISGGREQAEIKISLRTAESGSFERLEKLIREELGEFTCLRKGDPVKLDESAGYLQDFRSRMRRRWPDRKVDFYHLNSSTDARHLQVLGLPMLILGVDARGAHTLNEHVELSSLDDYDELIRTYLMDVYGGNS